MLPKEVWTARWRTHILFTHFQTFLDRMLEEAEVFDGSVVRRGPQSNDERPRMLRLHLQSRDFVNTETCFWTVC